MVLNVGATTLTVKKTRHQVLFLAVSVGGSYNSGFSCGLKLDKSIECWGSQTLNQTNAPSGQYTMIKSADRHSCAIHENGQIACWGTDIYGESSPPAGTFIDIAVAGSYACGIRTNGSIICWGTENDERSGAYKQIATGVTGHVCAVDNAGYVECWPGNNTQGAAGDNIPGNILTPLGNQ